MLVVIYRRLGTAYRFHLEGPSSPGRKPGNQPMVCLAIPAFERIAGICNSHLSYNMDFAYANGFPCPDAACCIVYLSLRINPKYRELGNTAV